MVDADTKNSGAGWVTRKGQMNARLLPMNSFFCVIACNFSNSE